MDLTALRSEILDLISLKTEGEYWDFKGKWHDNNADLLHDIICMANNLANRDAYLIIGVSDSKSPNGVQIIGVQNDHRKSQQNVIDFLKDKPFAGRIRPIVYVHTLNINDAVIDVLVVKNTAYTPFYLTEAYNSGKECVRAGFIYTRIGDTNTPKTQFADPDKVEYLWKKRFGLNLSVMERLLLLLDEPDRWVGDLGNGDRKYHSLYPEFQICIEETDQDYSNNSIVDNLRDHFCDKSFKARLLTITYHSTVLYSETVLYLDGCRHLIPLPNTNTIQLTPYYDEDNSLTYLYFDRSTVGGKLFYCLAMIDNNWYGEKLRNGIGKAFLLFDDDQQRQQFEQFARSRLPNLLEKYKKALDQKGYIETSSTNEYFAGGWSKANEIKSFYIYMGFLDRPKRPLIDYLPNPPQVGP